LGNGVLIESFYYSLFSPVEGLKKYSRKGFDLLMSFHEDSIEMMKRILPNCFFKVLLKKSIILIEKKGIFSSTFVEEKVKSQKWKEVLTFLEVTLLKFK
jgi:hypothetical protein